MGVLKSIMVCTSYNIHNNARHGYEVHTNFGMSWTEYLVSNIWWKALVDCFGKQLQKSSYGYDYNLCDFVPVLSISCVLFSDILTELALFITGNFNLLPSTGMAKTSFPQQGCRLCSYTHILDRLRLQPLHNVVRLVINLELQTCWCLSHDQIDKGSNMSSGSKDKDGSKIPAKNEDSWEICFTARRKLRKMSQLPSMPLIRPTLWGPSRAPLSLTASKRESDSHGVPPAARSSLRLKLASLITAVSRPCEKGALVKNL
jgi:hypothetical protein